MAEVLKYETREEWLMAAVDLFRPLFDAIDFPLPEKIMVSMSWPSGGARAKRVAAECYSAGASNGINQILVNPQEDRPELILVYLAHELCHAADDCRHGHRGPFVKAMKGIGCVKPWTGCVAGEELAAIITKMIGVLGEFPHNVLRAAGGTSRKKKQTTRMIKVVCRDCEYQVRTTQKWIDVGMPSCPNGDEMEIAA